MPMYNLIEHSHNCSKPSRSLWQYNGDEPVEKDVAITNSKSFKSKVKVTRKSHVHGNTKNAEITVPLKYLSKFWRTLKMPLIDC